MYVRPEQSSILLERHEETVYRCMETLQRIQSETMDAMRDLMIAQNYLNGIYPPPPPKA